MCPGNRDEVVLEFGRTGFDEHTVVNTGLQRVGSDAFVSQVHSANP